MLELRPNCECCDVDLPPASTEAMICTYECTFCRRCVDGHLMGICPNCGGNLCPRPIRPAFRLDRDPPSPQRIHAAAPCPLQ
ncbi:MAG TPA: DUF1272 domain-containing protein [Mycobacterium sp.]